MSSSNRESLLERGNIQRRHLVWKRSPYGQSIRESEVLGSGLWVWYFGDGRSQLGLTVMGVDIESAAIVSANENAKRNGLNASFSQTDIAQIEQQFDVVVANLFAEVLVALSKDILRVSTGYVALVSILATKSSMVETAFASLELIRKREMETG